MKTNSECVRVSMKNQTRIDEHRYVLITVSSPTVSSFSIYQTPWEALWLCILHYIGNTSSLEAHLYGTNVSNVTYDCIEHVFDFTFIPDWKTDRLRKLIQQCLGDINLHHVHCCLCFSEVTTHLYPVRLLRLNVHAIYFRFCSHYLHHDTVARDLWICIQQFMDALYTLSNRDINDINQLVRVIHPSHATLEMQGPAHILVPHVDDEIYSTRRRKFIQKRHFLEIFH